MSWVRLPPRNGRDYLTGRTDQCPPHGRRALRGTFGKAVDATELIVTDDTFQNAVPLPKAPLIAVSLSSSQPTLPPTQCSKFIGR